MSCPTGYGDRRFVIQKLPLRAEIRRGNSMILPDALIYRNMDQIVMIQQVDSNQTELEYQKEMEEVEDVIQRSILHRKKDTDFQIGIGKSVEGYQRLKESYHEASRAIKYIDIIRLVTGDKNKSCLLYTSDAADE